LLERGDGNGFVLQHMPQILAAIVQVQRLRVTGRAL
jgi:hypothetical protein